MLDRILRALPSFKGKLRIARLLLGNQISSGKDVTVKTGKSGTYLLPNLQENVGLNIFVNGIYEPATIGFWRKSSPGTVISLTSEQILEQYWYLYVNLEKTYR